MGILTIYGNNYSFEGLTFQSGTVNRHSRFVSAQFTDCCFEENIFDACDFTDADVFRISYKQSIFEKGTYQGVWFSHCDFSLVCFDGCVFVNSMFVDCNFTRARFTNCIFVDCELRDCQLGYRGNPTFCNGAITSCEYVPYIPMACPASGPIIGYKKATVLNTFSIGGFDVIVKLEIPEDAKRSSALGRKCRCNKAKVLGIYAIQQIVEPVGERENGIIDTVLRRRIGDKLDDNTIAYSKYVLTPGTRSNALPYKVGQWVFPDKWDDDRFKECAHGIHFFMNAQEAVDY